ncbi:hypothetical protein K2X33_13215 [bacterium]|nr:hypothetical protein [bacterium]
MKHAVVLGLALVLSACASKKAANTEGALDALNQKYSERVGKAYKTELVEEFGTASWCEPQPGGGESCRFYKSLGSRWRGDKENRNRYEAFDEVIADFDAGGLMRDYKARSQR